MKLLKISSIWRLLTCPVSTLQLACLLSGMVNCNLSYPQPVIEEWVRRYPDTNTFFAAANGLVLDDSGNVYVTGHAEATQWKSYCTIKYSSSGKQQWVASYYGNNNGGRYSYAIALDSFSNVYVTGYSFESGSYFDYCTIKYNSSGVQQWIRFYDGPVHGIDQPGKIAVDNAGNIYVTGFSQTAGSNSFVFTTIKYATEGRELWVRTYPEICTNNEVKGIVVDDSCNVYITGGDCKSITVKYDSSGNQLWARTYSGFGIGRTGANSIAVDKFKNVYITGYSNGLYTLSDYFTIKYSYSGVQEWVNRFNTDSTEYSNSNIANSIALDDIGNVYVSGSSSLNNASPMQFCTLKYTNLGNVIWTQIDSDTLTGQTTYMDIDKNNNIYIAGGNRLPAPYYSGITTIKYDSSGNQKWRQIYQIVGIAGPSSVKVDNIFNFYLSGTSAGNMCTIKYSQPVGVVSNNGRIPESFKLYQNYPNPFNPRTIIKFDLPFVGEKHVLYTSLKVYDILGREIAELVNEKLRPGVYQIEFEGIDYPSGVYFYRLIADMHVETRKMIIIK